MSFSRSTGAIAILVLLTAFGCAHEPENPALLHPELAVVRVGGSGPTSSCGFLISADGLVVTTSRIVAGGPTVNVTLSDGRTFPAKFVEDDHDGEVALVKIAGDKLPFLILAGETEPIIHIRIISPSGTTEGVFDRWENSGAAIGFTAHITPADSGAPVLADNGGVIGIVRAPSPDRGSTQLATPSWHVIRMLPAAAE